MQKIISSKHHTKLAFIVASLLAVVLVSYLSITRQAHAVAKTDTDDTHIITIHDDGVDKGFISKKSTLREALAEQKIAIDSRDRTEPALDTKLIANSYEVNIYRARPVLIEDGNSQLKVITSFRTGKQVAKEAGILLHDEDTATLRTATDLAEVGTPEVLTIRRAIPVNFVFYGKSVTVYTFAKTIGELLKQKNIIPAADDTLMPGASTVITEGLKVELWKNGEQTVTVDEDIPFETQQTQDANQDKGYKQVQTVGASGKKTVTYRITMQNGIEVKRDVVNSVTTKEPTKQVEIIGTKVELPAGSHTDWMAAAGIAASDYGYVDYIVGRESGWSPTKYNYAGSGAYGLCQSLPASKMASAGGDYMTNPITQLKWCNSYAVGRYGSWANAYNTWIAKHWW